MIASLESRVVRRFLARDFPSEKALEKYLHEHPKADPHKHDVVDQKEHAKKDQKGKGDEGHGSKDEGHGHGDGHDEGGMLSRLKGALKGIASKIKDAPADVQKFVADPKHRKEALSKGVAALKKAPAAYASQLVKTAKHEVHEFKTAGQGIAAVMKGKKPSAEQKKAIKAVAVHMAITIAAGVLTTATPALASMAVGKALGKHIALKAATAVLGDLHVLEEMGHIGHGLAHVLEHIAAKQEGDGDSKKAVPEEALAALVMKHVGKTMKDLSDDDLAKGLGGSDDEDEGQDKQAFRVAARYLA